MPVVDAIVVELGVQANAANAVIPKGVTGEELVEVNNDDTTEERQVVLHTVGVDGADISGTEQGDFAMETVDRESPASAATTVEGAKNFIVPHDVAQALETALPSEVFGGVTTLASSGNQTSGEVVLPTQDINFFAQALGAVARSAKMINFNVTHQNVKNEFNGTVNTGTMNNNEAPRNEDFEKKVMDHLKGIRVDQQKIMDLLQ